MDTNEKTRRSGQTRPAQRAQNVDSQQPRKAAPSQPQSAAQRRAVKLQQDKRQAAAQAQREKQRAQAKRPAPAVAPKKRKKKKTGLLGGMKLSQLGKKTNARANREQAARAAKLRAMKREVNQKEQVRRQRRKVSKPKKPGVPVVYTAPATFSAHRLVTQLVTIFAVVIAAVMCLSIFFKVEFIEISGASVYDEWTIREASGIQEGDNLLTFSRGRAGGRIKAQLQYVDQVRFGIKLPNTVIIDIEEFEVVYAVKASDGTWYLVNSAGKIVDQTDGGSAGSYTKILGVHLSGPIIGEQARAAEEIVAAPESTKPAEEDSTEVTVPQVLITNQSRLEAALRILRELENNGIVGEAASVDVSDMSHIELWYGTQYQVNLGGENDMDRKIADMKGTINQLAEYENGMLDISYDIWEDKVGYTPFS